ncbi:MAG: hypothetical protein V1835_02960 [Candidatus Micrarchaeota archaeon]
MATKKIPNGKPRKAAGPFPLHINRAFALFLFLLLSMNFAAAEEPLLASARIKDAQNALNVNGFNANSALSGVVSSGFRDSINPVTGALSITMTDAVVKGRNGMDVVLTRQYSSNVFLNINQGAAVVCDNPNGENDLTSPAVCSDCMTPSSIPYLSGNTRYMDRCANIQGLESASFIRPKYLGRGWKLNYLENRIKDPTPLAYDEFEFSLTAYRGINSLGMVTDNVEQQLILPAAFAPNNIIFNPGTDPIYSGWVYSDPGPRWTVGTTIGQTPNSVYKAQNGVLQGSLYAPRTYYYVAYTDDLSPVNMIYRKAASALWPPMDISMHSAIYHAKDGRTYGYTWNVPFCGKFDDMTTEAMRLGSGDEFCYDLDGDQLAKSKIMAWTENAYPGVYLTHILDSFGNMMQISYKKNLLSQSPFIDSIFIPGLGSNSVNFYYDQSPVTIDSKLKQIGVPNPKGGAQNQVLYRYESIGSPVPTKLLRASCIGPSWATGDDIQLASYGSDPCYSGTKYIYGYDTVSQELTYVKLPTGAEITYTYDWQDQVPSYDPLATYFTQEFGFYDMEKRVVVKKTIANGGSCINEEGNPTNVCSWAYEYSRSDPIPFGDGSNGYHYDMFTTVTDPFGSKTEYSSYGTISPGSSKVT